MLTHTRAKLGLSSSLLLVLCLACTKQEEKETSPSPTTEAKPGDKRPTSKPSAIPAPSDVAEAPPDAEKTASGLASKVLKPGTGDKHPGPKDTVEVHYTGWTTDGKMFDSSLTRGKPAKFALNRVIPGWTEGVQLMVVGEKRRFWIPPQLGYGDKPTAPGRPYGVLVFDVELLSVLEAPKPLPAPPDVAAPPPDATRTSSGLAFRILKPSKAKTRPTLRDRVAVHYTGWTTDGKMFDSSKIRGRPAVFSVGGVIKGWQEGLQLMTPGEQRRFWIPAALAYGEKPANPNAPAGMLVFDVELLEIQ